MTHSFRPWSLIIFVSTISTALVTFINITTAIRPILVLWFLLICPGMSLIQILRLEGRVAELTLAVALSFALEALLAWFMLYSGRWAPSWGLVTLMIISLGGVAIERIVVPAPQSTRSVPPDPERVVPEPETSKKMGWPPILRFVIMLIATSIVGGAIVRYTNPVAADLPVDQEGGLIVLMMVSIGAIIVQFVAISRQYLNAAVRWEQRSHYGSILVFIAMLLLTMVTAITMIQVGVSISMRMQNQTNQPGAAARTAQRFEVQRSPILSMLTIDVEARNNYDTDYVQYERGL